jgi:hypothetical protein
MKMTLINIIKTGRVSCFAAGRGMTNWALRVALDDGLRAMAITAPSSCFLVEGGVGRGTQAPSATIVERPGLGAQGPTCLESRRAPKEKWFGGWVCFLPPTNERPTSMHCIRSSVGPRSYEHRPPSGCPCATEVGEACVVEDGRGFCGRSPEDCDFGEWSSLHVVADPEVHSQLNGVNGEVTGTDDMSGINQALQQAAKITDANDGPRGRQALKVASKGNGGGGPVGKKAGVANGGGGPPPAAASSQVSKTGEDSSKVALSNRDGSHNGRNSARRSASRSSSVGVKPPAVAPLKLRTLLLYRTRVLGFRQPKARVLTVLTFLCDFVHRWREARRRRIALYHARRLHVIQAARRAYARLLLRRQRFIQRVRDWMVRRALEREIAGQEVPDDRPDMETRYILFDRDNLARTDLAGSCVPERVDECYQQVINRRYNANYNMAGVMINEPHLIYCRLEAQALPLYTNYGWVMNRTGVRYNECTNKRRCFELLGDIHSDLQARAYSLRMQSYNSYTRVHIYPCIYKWLENKFRGTALHSRSVGIWYRALILSTDGPYYASPARYSAERLFVTVLYYYQSMRANDAVSARVAPNEKLLVPEFNELGVRY